jgi:galactose mutarotase-like enzyme
VADREMIRIANDTLSAAINPFGAELSHLEDAQGRELMTDADPAFWTGRAPILFPIVGGLNGDVLRVDGREYAMKKHGFARRSLFELVDQAPTRAAFRLRDTDETRGSYPFAFELTIAFELDRNTLSISVTIANPGDRPLPAQFGFHPAFAWPLPYGQDRAAHRIVFAADEPAGLRQLTNDGLIMLAERPSPLHASAEHPPEPGSLAGRELHLADDLFEADALIWDQVRSQSVRYGAAKGPHLDIAFPDTFKLGIWTKPGAHYVCIEPWHGIADPEGFTGEFCDKPGVFTVAPGDAKHIGMSVTLAA